MPSDFARPKPLLLLAYLAVEGVKNRRHLAELFWSDASDPASSLRVALSQLRKDAAGSLVENGERLGLALKSDVSELLEVVRDGHFELLPPLYSGAFLEGFVLPDWGAELEEWVYGTREFIASQVRGGLLRVAEAEANQGRFLEAANHAQTAYKLQGARPLEPDDLKRLHSLLVVGDHLLAGEVRREAREFGIELASDPVAARQKFALGLEGTDAAHAVAHHLPSSKTSFVGRDLELVELGNALSGGEVRLMTLLGPGGIGKTRLALQAAHDQVGENHFRDGLYFVALEHLSPDQLPRALATALGVMVQGNADPLETIQNFLNNKAVLIVLDNFEHLTSEAGFISDLLEVCPNLVLLVTSRERLQLEEEFVLPILGVSVPKRGSRLSDAEFSDALRLFVQRAKRVRLDFVLSELDLPAVLEICRLVEGSPLGIELAAALVKMLPLPEIAGEIARNLDILETNSSNAKEAHRSLRAVFEQSWQRLSGREQDVFARLSVFQGGFRREDASALAGATIPVLGTLLDRSLLRVSPHGRYDLHALVLQYAREKLELQPRVFKTARAEHARFFLELAQTAAPELYGVSKAVWLSRLGQEHENFRAVLEWAKQQNELELGLRLAGALKNYWMIRGHVHEGGERLDQLLKLEAASEVRVPPDVRATALTGAAWLAHARDDFARATVLFEESTNLRRSLGETIQLEAALVNEAMLARSEGNYVRARQLLEQGLARHRDAKNRQSIGQDGLGLSLSRLALVLCEQGEYGSAEALCQESLALHRDLGDRGGIAATLLGLSDIAREQNQAERARDLAEESLKLFEELGEAWGVAFSLNNLALAAFAQGDFEHAKALAFDSTTRARTLWGGAPSAESLSSLSMIALASNDLEQARSALQESLTATRQYGPRWLVAVGLEGFAGLALREHQPKRAAWLLGASEVLRQNMGAPLSPLRRPMHERLVLETQNALEIDTWKNAYQLGGTTPLEQVIALALTNDPKPENSSQTASRKETS